MSTVIPFCRIMPHHMEECCLVFDMTIKSGGKKDYHSVCYLNKDKDSTVCFDIKYGNGYAYSDTEKKKKLLENMIMEENAVYSALPNNFCGAMKAVIDWRGITYKELGERIMVDDQTSYQKYYKQASLSPGKACV